MKDAIPVNVSQLTNDSGYLTEHQSLADYYTKSQVDGSINDVKNTIPTKTSQLTNDSGYLTEHQSLADYYTKTQTDAKIDEKINAAVCLVSVLCYLQSAHCGSLAVHINDLSDAERSQVVLSASEHVNEPYLSLLVVVEVCDDWLSQIISSQVLV